MVLSCSHFQIYADNFMLIYSKYSTNFLFNQDRKPYDPDFVGETVCAFPAATDSWDASGHARFAVNSSAGRRVNGSWQSGLDARPMNAVSDPFCTTNGRSVARRTGSASLFAPALSSTSAVGSPVISTSADWTVDGAASINHFTTGKTYNNGDIPTSVSTKSISRPSRQSSTDELRGTTSPSSGFSEVNDPFCTVRSPGSNSADAGAAGTALSMKGDSVPVGSDYPRGATSRSSGFSEGIDPFCTVRSTGRDSSDTKTADHLPPVKSNSVPGSSDKPRGVTSRSSGFGEGNDPFCTVRYSGADSADAISTGPRSSVKGNSVLGSSLVENPAEVSISSNLDEPSGKGSQRKKQQETLSALIAGDASSNISDMSDSQLIASSKSSRGNLDNSDSTLNLVVSTDANGAIRGNRLPGLQMENPSIDVEDVTRSSAEKRRKKKKKKSRSGSNGVQSSDLGRLDESKIPAADSAESQSSNRT